MNAPSFSFATTSGGCIAIAVDNTILVTTLDSKVSATTGVATVRSTQAVRALSFVQGTTPDAPPYLVSGGDNKLMHVFPLSHDVMLGGQQPITDSVAVCHGPHTKRVVHITGDGASGIIFGDKFGEVYALSAPLQAASPAAAVGSAPPAAAAATAADDDDDEGEEATTAGSQFLLQHFCLLSNVFLTSGSQSRHRKLITCDRDGHVRVSNYPHVYDIDRFLWTSPPQAMTIAVAEVPCSNPDALIVATGDLLGRLHLWTKSDESAAFTAQLAAAPQTDSATPEEGATAVDLQAITTVVTLATSTHTWLVWTRHSGTLEALALHPGGGGASGSLAPCGSSSSVAIPSACSSDRALVLSAISPNKALLILRDGSLATVSISSSPAAVVVEAVASSLMWKSAVAPYAEHLSSVELAWQYKSAFVDPRDAGKAAETEADGAKKKKSKIDN